MENDEAIARSLQYQEQDAASERRAQEARDAALAASLTEPAGSGAARISQEVQDQLLLLGLDQLRRFRCIIDLEQNVLVFGGAGGVQVPFLAQERVRRYIQRTPLDGCRQM